MRHHKAMAAFSMLFSSNPVNRRVLTRALASVAALAALAACGGDKPEAAPAMSEFRVALLTPGPISDQAWNGGAYDGLMALRDSLGAKVSHIQTKTPAEFEENFRQYGAQGYDMVVGHGFEFQDAALRVAPAYPNTVFICTSGNATAPNLSGMNFAFEEVSFQLGMIAGALTKTGIIGAIGGGDLPPVSASFKAYERGAKFSNPNVTVLISYLGTWDDVNAGKEQTLAQIARGADIVFQNADAAGLGIIAAAREKNILAFGANSNQNNIAPDHILGSIVINWPRAMLTVAREIQAAPYKSTVYQFGLRADVVNLVLNPKLESRLPDTLRARVDSVGNAIREGRFHEMDDVLRPADKRTDTARP